MMRHLCRVALIVNILLPVAAFAQDLSEIVDRHILPGYKKLSAQSDELASIARTHCNADKPELKNAYARAFDAWVSVSHLRFGPSEVNDRAFSLAFWPDTRGATPKALMSLITNQDGSVLDGNQFAENSIAARGFYALEYMLFGASFATIENSAYKCKLIQAITADIALNSGVIFEDWKDEYAALIRTAGSNDVYRSPAEATRQLFTALTTGLEFTSNMRLGRPLGTYGRPRPKRAEAWRSQRSLRHVQLSLEAIQELAALLSGHDEHLSRLFDLAIERAQKLKDPDLSGVATPQTRFRIEALQQSIDDVHEHVAANLGPRLGVASGFNAMDGD